MAAQPAPRGPILLLKTRSTPVDAYEELFAARGYDPVFAPVLEHRSRQAILDQVRQSILDRAFVPGAKESSQKYGGFIFTSQRAVEAFAQVVDEIRRQGHPVDELLPRALPFYAVGPATARQLRAIGLQCPILGEETGIGDKLAAVILDHYNGIHKGSNKPQLMFLVGDKRRDIIPKTLQSDDLAAETRIGLEELVIYETGEMMTFKSHFSSLWKEHARQGHARQWVVVFSPTGCKAMLESLGLLDEQNMGLRSKSRSKNRIYIATIGPTTRDYLINELGFTPDACAESPTPEGVEAAINAASPVSER